MEKPMGKYESLRPIGTRVKHLKTGVLGMVVEVLPSYSLYAHVDPPYEIEWDDPEMNYINCVYPKRKEIRHEKLKLETEL